MMVTVRFIIGSLALSAVCGSSGATNIQPWPLPRLAETADSVVVGVAARQDGKTVILVSEVLKGPATQRVVLSRVEGGRYGKDVLITPGDRGAFLLRKEDSGYAPITYGSFQKREKIPEVRAALQMLVDPGPFLDVRRHPESTDLLWVLGDRFTRWEFASREMPELEWPGPTFYTVAPWNEKRVVTAHCTVETEGKRVLRVTAEPSGSALAARLRYRLLLNFKSEGHRRAYPSRFSVTLDARLPESAGTATADAARNYARARLESSNPDMVLAALETLARMRDLDSVPAVLKLLDHQDSRVKLRAIEFLGWAEDPRAFEPLAELLEATAPGYPKQHAVSDATAEALSSIDGPRGLPVLERAATHGVHRAIEAIGAFGNAATFEPMLKALQEDPERCAYLDFALYWLVRRSNKPVEPWMTESSTTQAKQIARIPKWRAWWRVHERDFRVSKSQEQAVLESFRDQ